MITALLILTVIVWLPVLLYLMNNHSFIILLAWLFIAPVASNLINKPNANPLFQSPAEYHRKFIDQDSKNDRINDYFTNESRIEANRLAEPTRLLFVGFIFLFILNTLTRQQRLVPFDNTEFWMGLFLSILVSSAFFQSNNLFYSFRTVIDGFMVPFLAYVICRRLVTSKTRLIQLNRAFIYMAVYLIILGLIERAVHPGAYYRLAGPFREKNAIYIATCLPFFVVLADTIYSGGNRAGTAIVTPKVRWYILLLSPLITLLTMTRGNWAGFLLALGVFIAMAERLMNISRKMIALGLILTLLPTLAMLFLSIASIETLEQRAGNVSTIYGRFATWMIALEEVKKAPLFGIGLNNLRDALHESDFYYAGIRRYRSAHNSYLALLVEQGIVGLLTYLAIVMCILRKGLHFYRKGASLRERWWGVTMMTVMTAYLFPSMFGAKLHTTNPMLGVFVFALVGGLVGVYGQPRATVYRQPSRQLAVKRLNNADARD